MDDMRETWKREDGKIVIYREQDVQPYLEQNKRVRNSFQKRRNSRMRLVADIPNVVVEQWMRMGVNIFDKNDNKKVQQLLNSNEYAYLRTSPGKIAVK
jgi:hypothetical protein